MANTHKGKGRPLLLLVFALSASGFIQDLSEARLLGDASSRIQRMLRHFVDHSSSQNEYSPALDSAPQHQDFVQLPSFQETTTPVQTALAPAPGPSSSPFPPSFSPPSPGSPPTPGAKCPPTVNQCDFYFQGSESTVPTFNIAKGADSPISPKIVTSVQGSSIEVFVSNTAQAEYLCSQGQAPPPDDQFYTSGDFVQARVFQQGFLSYNNRYVRLNITSVQINAFGVVINVNPGQANNFFPESRRCVIFKVTA